MGNFLTSWVTISFSKRTLLHVVAWLVLKSVCFITFIINVQTFLLDWNFCKTEFHNNDRNCHVFKQGVGQGMTKAKMLLNWHASYHHVTNHKFKYLGPPPKWPWNTHKWLTQFSCRSTSYEFHKQFMQTISN